MRSNQLWIAIALSLAAAGAAYWYFRRRKATVLSSGKLYLADPAYDQAGY